MFKKESNDGIKANSPRVESSQGHNSDTLDEDEQGFTAACRNELKFTIWHYTWAAYDLVQHRRDDSFRGAAGDLDKVFKRVAAAEKVHRILKIACVTFGILGGGLLLGRAGITLFTFGVTLLTVSVAIGVHIWMTHGVRTTISEVVKSIPSLKLSDKWIYRNRDLCKDFIKKHKDYHEGLDRICQKYDESEENAIKTALGFNCDKDESEIIHFRSVHRKAKHVITEWNKALEIGTEAAAIAFVTGTCVEECLKSHGFVSRNIHACPYIGEVSSDGTLHVCDTGQSKCPGGRGPVVMRVAVQAAGGVVIGLSTLFMVVDLALISKTAYDLNKNKNGTELANKLQQAADDMEEETEILGPLANFYKF